MLVVMVMAVTVMMMMECDLLKTVSRYPWGLI